jgi:hypothetical protein
VVVTTFVVAFGVGETLAIDGLLADASEGWRTAVVDACLVITLIPLVLFPMAPWIDQLGPRRRPVLLAIGLVLVLLGVAAILSPLD